MTDLAYFEALDNQQYLSSADFFSKHSAHGLTYDDVSLATLYSEVLPKNTQTSVQLSDTIKLNIPIIASDMDTVTESEMAIAMAENGGLGIIHYNMSYEAQVMEVTKVKSYTPTQKNAALDKQSRLLCAVAIAIVRDANGQIDKAATLDHVEKIIQAGADAIAISSAHGFTQGAGEAIQLLRNQFKDLTIIAGNVTSASGVAFLTDCGANIIKIGQGPGSICTTRIVAGVGIPQLTALYVAAQAARKKGVKILADGGITKSGDIVKALTLADAVICGNMLTSCPEAPGQITEINGKQYKQYRGMGSLEAMQSGSAARYGHKKQNLLKAAAEGVEALKEVSSPACDILNQLVGGLQSGMGYLGAKDLNQLQAKAKYIQVSPASQKESRPHDVIELKHQKS